MKMISSPINPEVKLVVSLHAKKGRDAHRLFIVEGIRAITSFYEAGMGFTVIYCTEDAYGRYSDFTQQVPNLVLVSNSVMRKMSTMTSPSGILATFKIPVQSALTSDLLASAVVLYGISDPGNMGTLIRTAAALSCSAVVLIDSVDYLNPKVISSSAGAVALVPTIETDWGTLVDVKGDMKLCALVVDGGNSPGQIDIRTSVLVIGSEAHGLSKQVIDACEQRLTLPMPGSTESLNAAVAGSIGMYERYRARVINTKEHK